jgi:hypothetical protein
MNNTLLGNIAANLKVFIKKLICSSVLTLLCPTTKRSVVLSAMVMNKYPNISYKEYLCRVELVCGRHVIQHRLLYSLYGTGGVCLEVPARVRAYISMLPNRRSTDKLMYAEAGLVSLDIEIALT